jgi:hypothetical protein
MTSVLSAIGLAFGLLYMMVVHEERQILEAAKIRKSAFDSGCPGPSL